MDFVHLHTHSHYSLLDALPKISELVSAAKAQGSSAIALTDHANMYGAIEFYQACKKQGVKPIIGLELNVAKALFKEQQNNYESYHLVLLALNNAGYQNLMKLTSRANLEGYHNKPLVDKEMLKEHSDGLVCLSGCLEGELATIINKEKNIEKAKKVALEFQTIYGQDNYYLELCDLSALSGQIEVNAALINIGKELDIPLVVTRDAHYIDFDDAEGQDILTCIASGRILDEPDRPSMAGVDYSLAPGKDIVSRFKHVRVALQNTVKIAARVKLELELNKWTFPNIEIPPGKSADEHLRDKVYEKLPTLMEITNKVKERIEYELDIIKTKGYSPYFLVVADYMKYAMDNNITVTTRGSAAGSIVSYAIGITTVNPLYFKLPFERFLTVHRPSPPDVDGDFADDKRDQMIEYATKKYGHDKVAQIITFGTMAARGSVRDVGRALGYSYTFCDQIAKLIPFGAQGFQMTIEKALDLEPELKALYKKDGQVQRLLDLAQKIEGSARHTSIHAAGVVIAPTTLTDFTPIQKETGGEKIVTQYEMHSVEAAGLLKMDFLGIRNLAILGHAVEIVEKTVGEKVDIYNLFPWDNKKTYEMLARGETIGVFQMASSGMARYVKELKPTSIFDIMAMVALFRPGPMDSIPEYIKRKQHPEFIEYLDPKMEDYLDQSLGLIVYQDDVLLTAINLAGYNWEEADKFRKAMGKKIPAEMAKQKEKFFKGAKEFGKVTDIKIHRLWELIEPFAAYGFNKAHAASYGVVAYQTAYMKANFPIQFMTAVLIAESGDIDKVPAIIGECERMGIKVLPPDVNKSFKNFAMIAAEDDQAAHIRFGLQGIKNVGEHISEVIYRERRQNGSYKSLEDLLTRVQDKDLNKKSLESLIKCGAFDSLGSDRGVLLANIENILAFHKETHEQAITKQNSLFSGSAIDLNSSVRIEGAPKATADEKLIWEKELLGLYVTAHPFKPFQDLMGKVLTPLSELDDLERKKWVVVGGIIDKTKKKITRSGKAMMFVNIQDTSGIQELLVFPKTYETTKDVWAEGKIVCVLARTSEEEGDDKLFVERAYELTKNNAKLLAKQFASTGATVSIREYVSAEVKQKLATGVEIKLSKAEVKEKADNIKSILKKYPGDTQVYLVVDGKKIKTSYLVDCRDELKKELEVEVGGSRVS